MLARRTLAIIEAYSDPSRVSWNASLFNTGSQGLDDAAPAEMRTFVSRSAPELQDLEATRNCTANLVAKPNGSSADNGGGDDGDGGGKGGGRSRGKKPGRGARTRVQPGPGPG